MQEKWKTCAQDARYEVSSRGRIRTIATGKLRKTSPNGTGYPQLSVRMHGTKRQAIHAVHVLVAEAFLGPCPEGHWIHHIDENRANNHISNLQYKKRGKHTGDHMRKAWKDGKMTNHGETHYKAKLTKKNVEKMKELHRQGTSYAELGRMFNVTRSCVHQALSGITWRRD